MTANGAPKRRLPVLKPRTRGDCENVPRPCPWVSCRYNLYADVSEETGRIKINFPDLEPEEMAESCALDIADRGGVTLEEVGLLMRLTRERIRQIEVRGLLKVKTSRRLRQAFED